MPRAFIELNRPQPTASAMLRLIGFIYTVGIWGTFGVLIYTHWNECSGIGGCAYRVGFDLLLSLVWPLFWGGWIH